MGHKWSYSTPEGPKKQRDAATNNTEGRAHEWATRAYWHPDDRGSARKYTRPIRTHGCPQGPAGFTGAHGNRSRAARPERTSEIPWESRTATHGSHGGPTRDAREPTGTHKHRVEATGGDRSEQEPTKTLGPPRGALGTSFGNRTRFSAGNKNWQ